MSGLVYIERTFLVCCLLFQEHLYLYVKSSLIPLDGNIVIANIYDTFAWSQALF